MHLRPSPPNAFLREQTPAYAWAKTPTAKHSRETSAGRKAKSEEKIARIPGRWIASQKTAILNGYFLLFTDRYGPK